MNEVEAIGELAQGGLAARAAEPEAGERSGHTHESACLNCGTPLVGSHCHECGQRGHQHRTLSAFFHDLLHGVLHFEGKIWRTLPLLVWHPGRLTREYIDGRRASYISPIALFLFVVFLTFAAISLMGPALDFGGEVTLDGERVPVATAKADLAQRLQQYEAERREAVASGEATAELDDQIESTRRALRMVETIEADDVEGFAREMGTAEASGGDASGIDAAWRKAKENPGLLIYQLQANAYKFSWLLIPISVPFVWLLFPFSRRFRAYDHTVFVTYSLSFMTLLVMVATVGVTQNFAPLVLIPALFAPVHLYRQLRGTYGTSRAGAAVRTVALVGFGAAALALWSLALLGLVVA